MIIEQFDGALPFIRTQINGNDSDSSGTSVEYGPSYDERPGDLFVNFMRAVDRSESPPPLVNRRGRGDGGSMVGINHEGITVGVEDPHTVTDVPLIDQSVERYQMDEPDNHVYLNGNGELESRRPLIDRGADNTIGGNDISDITQVLQGGGQRLALNLRQIMVNGSFNERINNQDFQ